MIEQAFTVTEINNYIKELVDNEPQLRNVQIVEGTEAKPYSPYFNEQVTIPASVELDGTTVELNMASVSLTDEGGTYTATDYLTIDRGAKRVLYYQNVGKKTLTSGMDWSTYTYNGNLLFILRDNIGARKNYNPILANKYLGYRTVGFILSKDYGITTDAQFWGMSYRLTLRDTRFDNLTDFKADLDQNPLIVEYGLAEEITHDITNTNLGISLLDLTNKIPCGTIIIDASANLDVPVSVNYADWGGKYE